MIAEKWMFEIWMFEKMESCVGGVKKISRRNTIQDFILPNAFGGFGGIFYPTHCVGNLLRSYAYILLLIPNIVYSGTPINKGLGGTRIHVYSVPGLHTCKLFGYNSS